MAETLKKIQDLIEQNKVLEKRNEELKNIIDISLSRQNTEPSFPITDVIGKSEIESLVFKFFSSYRIPASLCNNKAEILFSIGWKKLFTSPAGLNKNSSCILDILGSIDTTSPEKKYYPHKCPNGFNAISFPIEIRKEHHATLILNQFFYKDEIPGYESIQKLTEIFETDEKVILELLSEIPVFTHNEIENIITQGILLSEMISFVGTKNYEFYKKFRQQTDTDILLNSLKKKIAEQDDIIKSLLKNITEHQRDINENTVRKSTLKKETNRLAYKLEHTESVLNSVLTSSPVGICFLKEDVITYSNDQMHHLTGFTTKELLGRPIGYLFNNLSDFEKVMESITPTTIEQITFLAKLKCKNGGTTETLGFLTPIHPGKSENGFTLSLLNINQLCNLPLKPELKSKLFGKLLPEKKLTIDWSDKTILIAEDEELNYIYLTKILMPTQVNILWAQNGKQAIEIFTQNPDISLILMDIKMPVMNGIDATRIIKTINNKIPVIAQTAYVQENTKEAIIDAGCDDFLAKPIIIDYFMDILKKYLS